MWTCCDKVNASTLEKLQRRAAQIIVNSSNSEQAMSSLAFDSLTDRCDKHVLKFVKKCIGGKAPQFFLIILYQITILHVAREYNVEKTLKYHGCVIFNKFQTK